MTLSSHTDTLSTDSCAWLAQGLFAAGPGAALIELLCIAVPGSICASLMAKYEERLMMAVTAVLGGGLLAKGFDLVRPLSSHDDDDMTRPHDMASSALV